MKFSSTVDKVNITITNNKNETLCEGIVDNMIFKCTTDGAIYDMLVNVALTSSKISPVFYPVLVDSATYKVNKQFAPELAGGRDSPKPTVIISLENVNNNW